MHRERYGRGAGRDAIVRGEEKLRSGFNWQGTAIARAFTHSNRRFMPWA